MDYEDGEYLSDSDDTQSRELEPILCPDCGEERISATQCSAEQMFSEYRVSHLNCALDRMHRNMETIDALLAFRGQ